MAERKINATYYLAVTFHQTQAREKDQQSTLAVNVETMAKTIKTPFYVPLATHGPTQNACSYLRTCSSTISSIQTSIGFVLVVLYQTLVIPSFLRSP